MNKGVGVCVYVGGCVAVSSPPLMTTPHEQTNMRTHTQVNDRLWQIPSAHGPETSDFVNHSCDANSGAFVIVWPARRRACLRTGFRDFITRHPHTHTHTPSRSRLG